MSRAATVHDLSQNILVGGTMVTYLIMVGCITVGILLIVYSFSAYRAHKENPKFMPLDRPVVYFILGVLMLCLPFASRIAGKTYSPVDHRRHRVEQLSIDPDAPLHLEED